MTDKILIYMSACIGFFSSSIVASKAVEDPHLWVPVILILIGASWATIIVPRL